MLPALSDIGRNDMVKRVSLRRAGGSVAIAIPKEIAERYHMKAGEDVLVVETDRGVLVTAYDSAFGTSMGMYERGACRFKNALRELAT
jgi:antitoxin MazE